MRSKNAAALIVSVSMLMTSLSVTGVSAEGDGIKTLDELRAAFAGTFGGEYSIENNIDVTNSGITANITVDGNGMTLNSTETTNDSTIYQNENVDSVLENLTVNGNEKPEVGIWEGAGSMTLNNVTVQNYKVSTVRMAAIGAGSSGSGKQGTLTLNNANFVNNGDYDINISDSATVNINEGSELKKLRLQSNTCTLNIGDNWTGEFEITMDSPASRSLGTVGDNADVSGITVSNEGYYIVNDNGELKIQNDNGTAMYFDMTERGELHKGSTGFLYGTEMI